MAGGSVDGPYFISYSRVDAAEFARRLANALLAGPPSYPVWLDVRDLQPGGGWDTQIRDALQASRGVLFVVTADSVDDHSAAKAEWVWALTHKKPVIPLRLDADAEPPFRLASMQSIDFSDGFDAGLARLHDHLRWMGSLEGVLQDLRDLLAEAERELPRADSEQRPRISQEIQELQRRVAKQERLVADPSAPTRRTEERIPIGLGRERQPERPAVKEQELQHTGAVLLPMTAQREAGTHAPARIFLSYRREETRWPTGRLFDRLSLRFGKDQVFKDVDSIELGDDFVEAITSAVASCDVLLALIGDRWLTITDQDGQRRLDDDNDFVRLEIEAALTRNVRIIPILVEGACMPRAAELPASMAKLVRRQALALNPDQEFESGVERLCKVLDMTLDEVHKARGASSL